MATGKRLEGVCVFVGRDFPERRIDVELRDIPLLQFVDDPDFSPMLDPVFAACETLRETLLVEKVFADEPDYDLVDFWLFDPERPHLRNDLAVAAFLIGAKMLHLFFDFIDSQGFFHYENVRVGECYVNKILRKSIEIKQIKSNFASPSTVNLIPLRVD